MRTLKLKPGYELGLIKGLYKSCKLPREKQFFKIIAYWGFILSL
jgi:hypothetical protein